MIESFFFCLSVRHGLLIWGYIKWVYSLLILLTFAYMSTLTFRGVLESYDQAMAFLQCVTTILPELLDLIFTLVLIVAAHKRNLKMLEVYYFYSITMLAIYTLVVSLTACNQPRFQLLHDLVFHHSWILDLDYPTLAGFGIANICLQAYLAMLVRSEVLKRREAQKAKLARQKSSSSFRGLRTGMVVKISPPVS